MGNPTVLKLGKKIRALRLEAGITLRELARQINQYPRYLSNLETGKRKDPPPDDEIIIIANALQVDSRELFSVIKKADPDLNQYIAQEPKAADFLRRAIDQGYSNDVWDAIDKFTRIANLGKDGDSK